MHGRLIAFVCGLAVGIAGAAYVVQGIYAKREAQRTIEIQRETLRAVENAQAETIRLQGVADEAIRKANKRAQANAAAATGARSELDGLRNELAAGSGAPACKAGAISSDPARELLAECAAALTDMAGKADGHALDALKLYDAWPQVSAND